jgi:cell shape-determining protein MreC
MRPASRRGKIQPRISTMPRQQTEASAYLDLHKLTLEKSRLQQELVSMEQRSQEIQQRMTALEQHMEHLKHNAGNDGQVIITTKIRKSVQSTSEGLPVDTIFLDY